MDLKQFLQPLGGEGIYQKIITSGIWSTIINVSDRVIWLLQTIFLARLLLPNDFGIIGISVLIVDLASRLTDLGFRDALISRQEDDIDHFLNTVWSVRLLRGFLVVIVFTLVSPYIAQFYSQPELTFVLIVYSIALLFEDMLNPSVIYFRKSLNFKKEFLLIICGRVFDFITAIIFAILIGDYWAIAAGFVFGRFSKLVASFVIDDFRPRFDIDLELVHELFQYGRWILGTGMVAFLATSGDDLFVGWYLAASTLGFYRLSFQLSNAPATELTQVITGVLLPAFSKVQNNEQKLKEIFLKSMSLNLLLVTPATVGIIIISPYLVPVLLGKKWVPMVPALQILAVSGFFRSIAKTGSSLFRGVGHPKLDFYMNSIRTCIILLSIFPLTSQYGIVGTSISVSLGIGFTIPYWAYHTSKITGIEYHSHAKSLLIPVFGSGLMTIPVLIFVNKSLLSVVTTIFLGASIYGGVIILMIKLRTPALSPLSENY